MKKKTVKTERNFRGWQGIFYIPYYLIVIKKGWKRILWIIIILAIIFGVQNLNYLKPYKKIEHYWEDGKLTNQISSIEIECPGRYPTIIGKIFSCGDYTSYYRNGNKSYHRSFDGKYEKYIDYFENGQKRVECYFEETPFVVNGNQLNRYQHSVEPCIFYNENGQIQKNYIEGQIEKDHDLFPDNGYWSGKNLQFSRLRYYNESGNIEKVEYYPLNIPFSDLYERDTRTPEGKEKEYFIGGILGQVEYYDKDGTLISTRVYATENRGFSNSTLTYYSEAGEIEKTEEYEYNEDRERELKMVKEYDKDGNFINSEM